MDLIIIAIFSVAFIFQILFSKTRFSNRKIGFFIFAAVFAAVFGFAIFISYRQYLLWKNDEMGKLFLPPYQNLDYFVYYARYRFFNSYLLSLIFGIGAFIAAKKMNKKYGGRFFEVIEPYLLMAGMSAQGTPGWILYLMVLLPMFLIINFFLSTFHFLSNKEMPRVSLYYFWLPAAIFTILISRWLSVLPLWLTLKF